MFFSLISFIFSIVLVTNLGVRVLIGFTVVLMFFGGPFILKLTPKTPSPILLQIKIFPTTGIQPITLLTVLAGIKVPFRLTNSFFTTYPSINKDIAGPIA